MNYKKLSLLLLLAIIATTSYSQDEIEPWPCGHDHQEREAPEALEGLAEEFDAEAEDNDHNTNGRTLQSYSNMRTYGYYGALGSGSFATYVSTKLVPPILDYFSAALRVKYPVSGLLKATGSSVCGIATPAVLRNGVNADYVYVVTTTASASFAASSSPCSYAPGSGRPIIGKTTISTNFITTTNDVLLHERNMICMMHELIHTLGFTDGMYTMWLGANGKKLSNPTTTSGGAKVITAEPIKSMLRNHFGCSSVAGAYLENSGGSGTAGSHFERRQFAYEIMTSGLIYQMQFSKFTLGVLESTGWFVPDYSYADVFSYGEGQGCGFLTQSCSSANNQFSDLCSTSARGCTTPGRGGANCASDARSDNCKFWQPSVQYDCENPNAGSYARLPQIQTFGRGKNSKCFTGTLSSGGSGGSSTSYCFTFSCSGSGSGTQLTIKLANGGSVLCTSKGAKTVSGYSGRIDCPDPVEFCNTVGSKTCPRNCMGRGTCNNGVCQCRKGSGTDCSGL